MFPFTGNSIFFLLRRWRWNKWVVVLVNGSINVVCFWQILFSFYLLHSATCMPRDEFIIFWISFLFLYKIWIILRSAKKKTVQRRAWYYSRVKCRVPITTHVCNAHRPLHLKATEIVAYAERGAFGLHFFTQRLIIGELIPFLKGKRQLESYFGFTRSKLSTLAAEKDFTVKGTDDRRWMLHATVRNCSKCCCKQGRLCASTC